MLSVIPFSVKNPSLSLLEQFSKIHPKYSSYDTTHFALAHLVEKTCANSEYGESIDECDNISNGWAKMYFHKLEAARSKKEKMLAIGFLANLKSVFVTNLLEPVAKGDMTQPSECHLQAAAIRASFWGSVKSQTTNELFLPIFLNVTNCREARIAALDQLLIPNNIDVTTLSLIARQMFTEKDIQILNYVYTLFDKYSVSRDSCTGKEKVKRVGHFLKYMKKLGLHRADYGFHVSQTHRHAYYDRRDARGDGYEVWLIGGGDSFIPAEIRIRLDSYLSRSYKINCLEIKLRMQGLPEALLELFYKRNEDIRDKKSLEDILKRYGILLKQRPSVEIEIAIKVKDVLVFQKLLTKDIFSNPRKDTLTEFASRLQNSNGQKNLHWFSLLSSGSQVNIVSYLHRQYLIYVNPYPSDL